MDLSLFQVILPFEASFYEKARVPVTFVGHPMLDLVKVSITRQQAAESFHLDPSRKIAGLFPGSRRSELEKLLPVIVDSARLLKQRFPNLQFVVPLASTLKEEEILPLFTASGIDVTITRDRIHDLIRACDAIVSVSGTVTLEIALVGTPMVIIYKLSPLTYQLAKRLVKISNIGLCNIVAGKTVVKELVQNNATPEKISAEIAEILYNQHYSAAIRQEMALIHEKLGGGGATGRVATLALDMLKPVGT